MPRSRKRGAHPALSRVRYIEGTVRNTVGRSRSTIAVTFSAVGQSDSRMTVAPSASPENRLFACGYAKNSFDVANRRSAGPTFRISAATRSQCRANRCGWTTAFGLPDVPDEWPQKAGASSSCRRGATATAFDCARDHSSRVTILSCHVASVPSRDSASTQRKRASERIASHSVAPSRGLTPTATPPAQIAPRNAVTHAMPSGSLTAIRSPGSRPRLRQSPAARATAARSSAYETRSSPQESAHRSGSPRASSTSAALIAMATLTPDAG